MVASVLGAGGLVVGQTPSPHLASYRERIVVDGRPIARDDLDAVLEEVLAAADGRRASLRPGDRVRAADRGRVPLVRPAPGRRRGHRGGPRRAPRRHEHLGRRRGGRSRTSGSTTGVPRPTVESIAREKAAIIKRGDRAVTGASGARARRSSGGARRGCASRWRSSSRCPWSHAAPTGSSVDAPRLGELRVGSGRTAPGRERGRRARRARRARGGGIAEVDDDAIRRRSRGGALAGSARDDRRRRRRRLVLDGAHNPDGAAALVAALAELRPSLPPGRVTLLLGILADKEVDEMLAALASEPELAARAARRDRCPRHRPSAPERCARRPVAGARRDRRATRRRSTDVDAALERAMALARAQRRAARRGGIAVPRRARARAARRRVARPGRCTRSANDARTRP